MSDSRPWFKAKTYGWGWGLANTWQGWVTYASYVGLVVASGIFFPPGQASAQFIASVSIWSATLFGICLLKGEKPKWHWGR